MADKRVQRIKLKLVDSPVKFDGTVLEASADGKRITVEFDGPLETRRLFAHGKATMVSDMFDQDGKPTEDFLLARKCQFWEVL